MLFPAYKMLPTAYTPAVIPLPAPILVQSAFEFLNVPPDSAVLRSAASVRKPLKPLVEIRRTPVQW